MGFIEQVEKKKSDDLTNLLYSLHVSPVADAIGIKEITEDPILNELIKSGKNYIPKSKPNLNPYREILSEIRCVSNVTLLKHDKIILPETLFGKAIKLAHSGAHPGQNGLIRRLRSNFFFKNLEKKAAEYVNSCSYFQMFTNKVYRHPIRPNKVPERCWEETSVDLFGPLPSKNHIVVIQDLASRYPSAKLIESTNAKSDINVLDTFGNPIREKSDNGPSFNFKEMENLTKNRNIEQFKTPPGHPSPNNVETVVKPLGKAMKIGRFQNQGEKGTLSSFLVNYCDTPHSATGVSPAQMIFRDGYRSNLPHKSLSDQKINTARLRDQNKKTDKKNVYNSCCLIKDFSFQTVDRVLVRNYRRRSKFEPYFLPEKFRVIEILANGNALLIKNTVSGLCLQRHPNDIKMFNGSLPSLLELAFQNDNITYDKNLHWRNAFDFIAKNEHPDNDEPFQKANPYQASLRRSTRLHKPYPKYFNDYFKIQLQSQ